MRSSEVAFQIGEKNIHATGGGRTITEKADVAFEDAAALLSEAPTDVRKDKGSKDGFKATSAGLLQEIHVESEIGRQEDGKQVLKNVGKVEKFVLEQVRKIFEEEFVFPSYWTFLV